VVGSEHPEHVPLYGAPLDQKAVEHEFKRGYPYEVHLGSDRRLGSFLVWLSEDKPDEAAVETVREELAKEDPRLIPSMDDLAQRDQPHDLDVYYRAILLPETAFPRVEKLKHNTAVAIDNITDRVSSSVVLRPSQHAARSEEYL
jgi:hypothetical protein